jgi:hypothetical protein
VDELHKFPSNHVVLGYQLREDSSLICPSEAREWLQVSIPSVIAFTHSDNAATFHNISSILSYMDHREDILAAVPGGCRDI